MKCLAGWNIITNFAPVILKTILFTTNGKD